MVDNVNPTNQFHPYQPVDAIPQTGIRSSGLSSILKKVGIDSSRLGSVRNMNMGQSVDKFRGYAQQNPGKVLGGLAALAIGLGMMRGRGIR
ncbi:MAG TPA: hypothetical protein VF057_08060 [Thermoanaerobaculia bacterium]